MKVEIQFEAVLRLKAGFGSLQLEFEEGETLQTIVDRAAKQVNADVQGHLFDSDGKIRSSILCFVDNQPVAASEAGEMNMKDGAVVMLMPPIAGG